MRGQVALREIPFIKLGHCIRFDPADIERWIDAGRVDSHDGLRPGA